MTPQLAGPWSNLEIDEYLQSSVFPLRLAFNASDGFPRVVSLWFRYEQGVFYCVSHRDSKLVGLLRENKKVGFEVSTNEPPYCGVRGQGLAELAQQGAGEALALLLERFLDGTESPLGKWLLSRSDDEVLISVQPHRLFSWDYRKRMGTGSS